MKEKPKIKKLPSYAFPACSTTSMMPGAFYCMEKKKKTAKKKGKIKKK